MLFEATPDLPSQWAALAEWSGVPQPTPQPDSDSEPGPFDTLVCGTQNDGDVYGYFPSGETCASMLGSGSHTCDFDFGPAAGRTLGVPARRLGFSTLESRFSRVIEAGAGGLTARVGAKAGGTVVRLVTPRDWSGFGGAADVAVFGRFNVERGIWRGGFAK